MSLFKDYDMDIIGLRNAINQLNSEINDIRKYNNDKIKELENIVKSIRTDIENIKQAIKQLKYVKETVPYAQLSSRIERLEKIINSRTITKIELNTFHLTKAQNLLLNYCNTPKTFKEMDQFMKDHGYTMGMNFQKLKDLGLIRKEGKKWVKVKEITDIPENLKGHIEI